MATKGTLYVFLHGMAVGCEQRGSLEIVLPRIPGHVYRAGSWLMETDIAPKSTLRLRGVTPGQETLAAADPVIHLRGCALTNSKRAATLWLPHPKNILEMLITEDSALVWITNPAPGVGFASGANHLTQVAGMLVFIYDYDDENELYLENHYWEPCSTGGATSLHIISTSLGPEGKDHEVDTQYVLSKLVADYPGLSFTKPPSSRAPSWNEPSRQGYGELSTKGLKASGEYIVTNPGEQFAFAQAELEAIPSRTTRIGRLGRMKQQARSTSNLWFEPDPLFETSCDCGFLHVRRP